ncbi:ChbG/HpnK family deacetylase [candidate division KSB1 bacterium]|nr:ChbG/HpnK family deacetylase [candidate division KSB1 bacterium]NIR71068.1 ChbG/HpnK family deacetylase [candidate division KSB1 bacterium]NIS24772.1 ChbG/HpnK family deacetylase [candidate division KSB1 bacterium]NIT71677.1 ChbG/HpnK family deacetylase [candidate division KSB1 bacterium]NIU25384.1 ChbG/HpnK family deacetylase [candidate division KSB1 bacterium]
MNENRNRRKIIVNADDFGITAGVNQAIIELAESGAITSTSLMTNMPLAAGATLVKHKIGTGVHLNLTTGRPVSDPQQIPSLVNRSGEFHCLSVLLQRYRTRRLSKSEIELEFTAQMKRAFEIGMCPDHFDAHESLLKYPLFEAVARKVAHDFGVNAVRTYRQQKVVLLSDFAKT